MLVALDVERIDLLADGAEFGTAGVYERVVATARGEVDPLDPANQGIVNIDKAPRNETTELLTVAMCVFCAPRIRPEATAAFFTK